MNARPWSRALAFVALLGVSLPALAAERVVVLGAELAVIVEALGRGDAVVAADHSAREALPARGWADVGNVRALAVEGVLAARPDLVLATERVGPPAALDRLRDAGVRVEVLAGPKDLAAAHARTRALGRLLGASAAAESLVAAIDGALTAVPRTGAAAAVAFVYARGAGTLLVGGTGTAPAALVALAGGKNAVTAWEGFKPLTPEALVGAAPEVFLMTASGLASLGGVDGLLAAPGVALTPAGRARAVVTLDDLAVLDLGPDVAETVTQLARALEGVR